jgi:hypothetical protein
MNTIETISLDKGTNNRQNPATHQNATYYKVHSSFFDALFVEVWLKNFYQVT